MQEGIVVKHPEFGAIWTQKKDDGSLWFAAKDVCDVLGYGNSREAVKKHVPEKEAAVAIRYLRSEADVTNRDTEAKGRYNEFSIISEAGLYRLIFRSKMPAAERFTDWVCGEVLPALRKEGTYSIPKPEPTAKQLLSENIKSEKAARAELRMEIYRHITETDIKLIASRTHQTCNTVKSVLRGSVVDTTIMLELVTRSMNNRSIYAKLYTPKGIAQTLEVLRGKN